MNRRVLMGALLGSSVFALPTATLADDVDVQPGDTLSELSEDHYGAGDWTTVMAVATFNNIADPNLIYVGDVIKFPEDINVTPAPDPAPVEEEVWHNPGTDWDGDGVVEPEPGEEPVYEEPEEEYVEPEEPDTADPAPEPDYDDGGAYWPWDALAECESGGDWHISTGNGYYGGLQFSLSTWQAVGGSGYPHENSMSEQIHRAEILRDQNGGYGAWPACSAQLGL